MKTSILLVLALAITACQQPPAAPNVEAPSLTKTFINTHNGYSEAVVVQTGNLKTIYISGQISEADTFEAQMREVLTNMKTTLQASGATFKDVVKMNTYIVDYSPELLPAFRKVRKEMLGDTDMPASTLVGVAALGKESWKIEIEAIAVLQE